MIIRITRSVLCFFVLSNLGCVSYRDLPKYQLSDGVYKSNLFQPESPSALVEVEGETITALSTKKNQPDMSSVKVFPVTSSVPVQLHTRFNKSSLDIDFLTIPFKFRPGLQNFPPQFNTNLNGAVYGGYRRDIFNIRYKKSPTGNFERRISHYGLSLGVVTGLGGTAMNPSVTNNQISIEYDGVVWSKGFSFILGVDQFSFALVLGWDTLLDKYRDAWLYNGKPWIGLGFGLNLN